MSLIAAYAKINIGLRVLGKRPDGYHEIDTIFQTISLADELLIERTPHDLRVEMSPDGGLPERENLVYRAARALLDRTHPDSGLHIRIKKEIPFASGLGGASSDAAATLVALNAMLGLKLDQGELQELALQLGSDVPFFLVGGCCRGRGRGERLERLLPALSDQQIVLFKPEGFLSSAAVYRQFDHLPRVQPASVQSLRSIQKGPFDCANDLSEAAVRLYPEIRRYQDYLAAQRVALGGLSGSGPTFYAIFAERYSAESFARAASEQLGAWVRIVRATDAPHRWITAL
jgi:4-diphosphocytidyl-2-C-methyl-D-erythritol kinase